MLPNPTDPYPATPHQCRTFMRWFDQILLAARLAKPGVGGRIIALLFGVLFGGGGCLALWSLFLGPLLEYRASQSWEETTAKVTQSELKATAGNKGGTSYAIKIRYDFYWRGRLHHGDRYDFTKGSTNIAVDSMRRVVAAHPVGKSVTVWVNPAAPAKSVLHRGIGNLGLMGLFFALPFLTVGVCGLSFALFSGLWFRRSLALAEAASQEARRAGLPLLAETLARAPASSRANEIRHYDSHFLPGRRWLDAAGLLALCLFWNGIVGVFLCVMLAAIVSGDPPWFLILFLIPFEIIGVIFIVALVKQIRSPRPPHLLLANRLEESDSGARKLDLEWLISGQEAPVRLAFQPSPSTTAFWKNLKRSAVSSALPEGAIAAPAGSKGTLTLPVPAQPENQRWLKSCSTDLSLQVLWSHDGLTWGRQTLVLTISPKNRG